MAEKLMFANVVESLFIHGLSERMNDPCRAKLRQAGLDLARPLLPGYPHAVWERCVEVAAEELYPTVPRPQALAQLGRRLICGMVDGTVAGRALPLLQVMGTRRAVRRVLTHKGSSDNFITFRYEEQSPTSARLHLSDVGRTPEVSVGSFEEVIFRLGGQKPRVRLVELTSPGAWYQLTWEA